MAVICPTVTTDDPHVYREQIERVEPFARRIHIDIADGVLTPNKLINVHKIWWPADMTADIHVMYQTPEEVLGALIEYRPSLVILHAEADGNFMAMAERLKKANIKVGLALLQGSQVSSILTVLDVLDHVLIFSGSLGRFGGSADLAQLSKAAEIKLLRPIIEIGWDGGVNDLNAKTLSDAGVDVLNTGGFIHRTDDPAGAYAILQKLTKK